ncbi:MAG: SDR family NAD(P)-dependent oxidoreductase [Dehalococcoidia bacterium]|nr:SDR family NAD(P)-dependent oxidoreductase [Dehalococcoidia bacterium]
MGRFDGKVAVITAAAGAGISHAVAHTLAREGANLVISDIHPRRTQETAEALCKEFDREVVGFVADVTKCDQVDALIETAIKKFGRMDIMHNNTGFNKLEHTWEMTDENWHNVIAVNLDGTFYGTRAVLPHMMRQKSGVIINMSSMHGYSGGDGIGEAHYAAAKAVISGFTKAVALEVGEYNIRVNALAPGVIENPFLHRNYPEK